MELILNQHYGLMENLKGWNITKQFKVITFAEFFSTFISFKILKF